MQVNDTARLLRVSAVAEMFDVSVSTIYRAIEAGQLDALKIGTGRKAALRVPAAAVSAYLEACAQAAQESYVRDSATGEGSQPGADVVAGEVA